jgi:hypothetical protein
VRQHQRPKQIAPILKAGVKIGFDHQHHLHSALVHFVSATSSSTRGVSMQWAAHRKALGPRSTGRTVSTTISGNVSIDHPPPFVELMTGSYEAAPASPDAPGGPSLRDRALTCEPPIWFRGSAAKESGASHGARYDAPGCCISLFWGRDVASPSKHIPAGNSCSSDPSMLEGPTKSTRNTCVCLCLSFCKPNGETGRPNQRPPQESD